MNVALRKAWTVESFLAWEARQELRHEFDGVRPIGMTGGTAAHDLIQVALIRALGNRLDGKRCRVRGNSLKIHVLGSIRYPDAFITCSPIPADATVAPDPVVVFEISSKSTARTDRMVKNREYAATRSIRRYVMLEQGAVEGMMFVRTGEGEDWIGHLLGPDSVIAMPEADIELPIAELYREVDLSEPVEDDTEAV